MESNPASFKEATGIPCERKRSAVASELATAASNRWRVWGQRVDEAIGGRACAHANDGFGRQKAVNIVGRSDTNFLFDGFGRHVYSGHLEDRGTLVTLDKDASVDKTIRRF